MLHINSGKMFRNEPEERQLVRGVLNTNLRFGRQEPIRTAAGNLLPVHNLRDPSTLIFETTERFEKNPPVAENVVSHGVDPYLREIATIVSFSLMATCTPDYQLTHRLISDRPNLMGDAQPRDLIPRVFDSQVWFQPSDADRLVKFTGDLIALDRRSHLAALRAMTTYITGLHRIADDYELAYTLLVASIESLVQNFDGHEPQWTDYAQWKRARIDAALVGLDEAQARRVRKAILEIEHTSTSRKFREFALGHMESSRLQEDPQGWTKRDRRELRKALWEAYDIRSRYLHELATMPNEIKMPGTYSYFIESRGRLFLTFQGLAQVARQVITEFINRSPRVDREDYNYHLERFAVVHLPTSEITQEPEAANE